MKQWFDKHGPDATSKLAIESGVSSSVIRKVRSGFTPKKSSTRMKICKAMRVAESRLFPSVSALEEEAS